MSRSGRGGGGKKGPDLSWDDEDTTSESTNNARKPGKLFPKIEFPVPKPLSSVEKSGIRNLLKIRDRIRKGPLYAVLDPTIPKINPLTVATTPETREKQNQALSKPNPRAGFDPFTDQEKYTNKYHRKRRTVPDLAERGGYTLRFFPLELWNVLDPKRRMKEWENLSEEQKARIDPTGKKGKKRKRGMLKFADNDDDDVTVRAESRSGSVASDADDDEDVVASGRRRKKNKDKEQDNERRSTKQKKGLDAEDDYPDVDQDEDGEGNARGEDEPSDSEFGTDDEDEEGIDDYNAEQYFDDGADEGDFGDGDGDGEGGVY